MHTTLTQTQTQIHTHTLHRPVNSSLISIFILFSLLATLSPWYFSLGKEKRITNQTAKKNPTKIESQFRTNFIIQSAHSLSNHKLLKIGEKKKSILADKRRERENVIFSIFNKTKIFRFSSCGCVRFIIFFCVCASSSFFSQWLAFRNSNVATNKQTSNGSCLSFTLRCIHALNTSFFGCYTIALMRIRTHGN